jgi:malate synthase
MPDWKIPAHQSTNSRTSHAYQKSGANSCLSMGISGPGGAQRASNSTANGRSECYV